MEQAEFRKRMRAARELAGLDQKELASRLFEDGWTKSDDQTLVSNIENGKRSPAPKVMEAIAEYCRVPYRFLIDESYDPFRVGELLVTGDTVTYVNARGETEVMTVWEARARGLVPEQPPSETHLPTDSSQQQDERSSGAQDR